MTLEDTMERQSYRLIFNLRDVFFVATMAAIFLSARQWAISLEDERFVALGISIVGFATPVYAVLRKARYIFVYLFSAMASFVVSTEWACECVFKSADTSFLRNHTIPGSYSADTELNALMVIVSTIGMTVTGGTLGAICKFLVCRFRDARTNKRMARSGRSAAFTCADATNRTPSS